MYALEQLIEIAEWKESLGQNPLGPNCHAACMDPDLAMLSRTKQPDEPCVTYRVATSPSGEAKLVPVEKEE